MELRRVLFRSKQFGPPQELNLELLQGKGRWRIVLAAGSVGVLGVILFAYGTAGSLSGLFASSRFEFRLKPASPIMRSEEHTSELQSLMRISYAVFCL